MQEKTKPVFVVATANNIQALPAEMLRKGRFDEVFFVDIPTQREREEIFRLHLEKRLKRSDILGTIQLNPSLYSELASITEGFSGAEIEQAVIAALFEAFAEERVLQKQDFLKVIHNTVPLSVTQSEQIMQIREWADVRAVAATAAEDRNEYKARNSEDIQIQHIEGAAENVRKMRGGRSVDF